MASRLAVIGAGCVFLWAAHAGAGNLGIRTFDRTPTHNLDGKSVADAGDGSLVFVGYDSTSLALTLTKVSSTGALVWARLFSYGSAWMTPRRIVRTSDGGFAVAGDLNGDKGILLRFDATGGLTLQRAYGITSSSFYDVEQTEDGGFILSGETGDYDVGSGDAWLVKTDSAGNVDWSMAYGGLHAEEHIRAEQTKDGGYIVSGSSDSFGEGTVQLWVMKLTSGGTPVWQKVYTGANWSIGWAVETADGGYVVSGWVGTDGLADLLLVRLGSTGTLAWARAYGGTGYDLGSPHPAITSDGGFLISGTTEGFGAVLQDAWLLKTDSSGNLLWQKRFGSSWSDSTTDGPIESASSGAILVGKFRPSSSESRAFVARTASDGTIDSSCSAVWIDTTAAAVPVSLTVADTACVVTPVTLTPVTTGLSESAPLIAAEELCASAELADLAGSFTKLKKKGNKINATYACVNYGTVASSSFTVKVYLSKKITVGPKSKVILTKVVGSLAPGGVASVKASGEKTSKTKYVVTVLDPTGAVPETDEGNNKTVALVP